MKIKTASRFANLNNFLKTVVYLIWSILVNKAIGNLRIECSFLETERPNWSALHLDKVQQHTIWVHFYKCGSRKSTALYFCHCCTQVNKAVEIFSPLTFLLKIHFLLNVFPMLCFVAGPMRPLRCTGTWSCERLSFKISSWDFCPGSKCTIKSMEFGIYPVIR